MVTPCGLLRNLYTMNRQIAADLPRQVIRTVIPTPEVTNQKRQVELSRKGTTAGPCIPAKILLAYFDDVFRWQRSIWVEGYRTVD
jgi:hypothetical protein